MDEDFFILLKSKRNDINIIKEIIIKKNDNFNGIFSFPMDIWHLSESDNVSIPIERNFGQFYESEISWILENGNEDFNVTKGSV